MKDKFEECAMNARKIHLNLEVAFWNLIISFLTVFKEMRTFSQGTTAQMPSLRKMNDEKSISTCFKLTNIKLQIKHKDFIKLAIRASFWAMLGFVLGFLYGLLIGF